MGKRKNRTALLKVFAKVIAKEKALLKNEKGLLTDFVKEIFIDLPPFRPQASLSEI